MKSDTVARLRADRVWLTADACDLDDFIAATARTTVLDDYPLASAVERNVLVYDGDAVRRVAGEPESRRALLAEWAEAMLAGPGIVVCKNAFADKGPVDAATRLFQAMIAEQHRTNTGGGDHFAKPGANDRVWNGLEKLCLADPAAFAQVEPDQFGRAAADVEDEGAGFGAVE